jgi:aspartate kinase
MEKSVIVNGVAFDTRVAKITIAGVPDIPGVAMNIFNRLAKENINVDMIVQSNHNGEVNDISFTVSTSESKAALTVMEELNQVLKAQGISFDDTVSKISIVGAGMQSNPGVAASMFEALSEADINIQMISTSEIKVSCIIAREEVQGAVKALHDKFELERE